MTSVAELAPPHDRPRRQRRPEPYVRLRKELAELRAEHGYDFETAWRVAISRALRGDPQAPFWRVVWREQRDHWEAAYNRRPGRAVALAVEMVTADSARR